MTDWDAQSILNGAEDVWEYARRIESFEARQREVMADPAKVEITMIGRDGYRVTLSEEVQKGYHLEFDSVTDNTDPYRIIDQPWRPILQPPVLRRRSYTISIVSEESELSDVAARL